MLLIAIHLVNNFDTYYKFMFAIESNSFQQNSQDWNLDWPTYKLINLMEKTHLWLIKFSSIR